jgi:hypothetical protein
MSDRWSDKFSGLLPATALYRLARRVRGRERLRETLGRLVRKKAGSLPPNLVIFSVSLFSTSRLLFPRFPETYEVHKEKKMVKTKLKYVIPTFFTYFVQIPTARTERNSGWAGATDESLWPRNRVQKGGRSSPTRCFARVQIDRHAMRNLLFLRRLLGRQGDRKGDAYSDLGLSCTLHLPALQVSIEALWNSHAPHQ